MLIKKFEMKIVVELSNESFFIKLCKLDRIDNFLKLIRYKLIRILLVCLIGYMVKI